jgi:hypothetical protein
MSSPDPKFSRRDVVQVAAATLAAVGTPLAGLADEDLRLPERSARAGTQGVEHVRGMVFEDRNGLGKRQAGDPGLPGVLVSNGYEVARTGADGSYSLPVADGDAIFVIKPSGYAVPLDAATCLPRFSYIHRPQGTPASLGLAYSGLSPTGPLPTSLDFPLVPTTEPDCFDVVLFADPQPENETEVTFVRDDVISGLIGTKAAFGITAGDIMFDDLSLFDRYNRIIGQIGIPWWNVGGNHDLNFEALDARASRETYKRVFGAPYYAFEYGSALFIMLDNVDYLGTDSLRPRKAGKYRGQFGARQLAFIANVLKATPADRLVVAVMHIPLKNDLDPDNPANHTRDRAEFLALLKDRKSVSLAGHTHTTEHHYLDTADGFAGPSPHHHHILTTVSGSWWSGPCDRRGIASADSRDGAPHGFHILSIEGSSYTTRFVPANEPNGRQMRISIVGGFEKRGGGAGDCTPVLGSSLTRDELAEAILVVNFFDGGPKSRLSYRVGASGSFPMTRERRPDPFVEEVYRRHRQAIKSWVKAEPSSHIWTARFPAKLALGTHLIEVTALDEYDREHRDQIILEVMG